MFCTAHIQQAARLDQPNRGENEQIMRILIFNILADIDEAK